MTDDSNRVPIRRRSSVLKTLGAGTTLVCLLLGVVAMPTPARAYTRETHYYLRFGLALATCFDYDEAHLIASGDWMMDGNLSTHAEPTPFQKRNKVGFHAFGHSDARFNELWARARAEQDPELRLIKLGQFMHFLEDWESHAGFGLVLGHAKATFGGRDPDSLGSDADKNYRMVQSALEHLLRTCTYIGRTGDASVSEDADYYLVWLMRLIQQDGLMEDLYEIGDPSWKKGKIKGVRKSHQEIRVRTRVRIEEFVNGLKAYPNKKVPEWFEPGNPERGIPLVLQIPYDRNGDILARPGSPDPVEEVLARNRADREEEDLRIYIDSFSQLSPGFIVQLFAENVGSETSDPGSIDVYVIDPNQQQELGSASIDLESLQAGERVEKSVTVRARPKSGQRVMIGALVRVDDFSAMDNEAWLMSEEEASEPPEVPLVTDVDPDLPGEERIAFSDDPKIWLIDEEAVCVWVSAATSEGDATEKLISIDLQVVTEQGDLISGNREFPARWGASAREGDLIAARTFGCFEISGEQCETLGRLSPTELYAAFSLEAPGLRTVSGDFLIPGEVLAKVKVMCRLTDQVDRVEEARSERHAPDAPLVVGCIDRSRHGFEFGFCIGP
jgi:hypothetical protein